VNLSGILPSGQRTQQANIAAARLRSAEGDAGIRHGANAFPRRPLETGAVGTLFPDTLPSRSPAPLLLPAPGVPDGTGGATDGAGAGSPEPVSPEALSWLRAWLRENMLMLPGQAEN